MTALRVPLLAVAASILLGLPLLASPAATAEVAPPVQVGEFVVPDDVMCKLREQWLDRIAAEYAPGSWAPMRMDLDDAQLAMLGLPPAAVLAAANFDEPTAVYPDGTMVTLDSLAVASWAGTGCFGIRPGAFLLLLDGGIGWCSMAHVYGSAGSYKISTAGHCGKTGHRATVVGAISETGVPVLLTFGKFGSSTNGGIGRDKALLTVESRYQHLVSPTMCFWGGPLGVYTGEGAVASLSWSNNGVTPTVNPNPMLAETIVHYGHGTGVGAGGTPRAGVAIDWRDSYFTWFGAITPGDSGSASNAIGAGAVNAAAGINTHIYVDGLQLFKTGTGILASTRVTSVGTPADGQIVPYPVPVPGAP